MLAPRYLALSALLIAGAAPAQGAVGPEAAACDNGRGPAVLVKVDGFKEREGVLRVQLYGSNPADFLGKGKKLKRIEVPVPASGAVPVCVAVPRPGSYAIAVRHDLDGNGKSGWSDGGGFSGNPKLSLTSLKPKYEQVAFSVGNGVRSVPVILNYRRGLSIRPVNAG